MKTTLSLLLLAVLGTSLAAQVRPHREGGHAGRFFDLLDADANGFLTEGEVLNAVLTEQMLPRQERVVLAGAVDEDSARPSRISRVNPEDFVRQLYGRADLNQDAVISREEFLNQTARRPAPFRQG